MVVCIVFSPFFDKWTFTWGNHTLHFVLLSPVVGLMAITSGETAVLKGGAQVATVGAHIALLRVLGAIVLCPYLL